VRRVRRRTPSVRPADAAALAKKLISAQGSPEEAPPEAGDVFDDAIANDLPVHIEYVNKRGERSSRLINPTEIVDDRILLAWCHLRNEERAFALNRILSVSKP
jgi:predicted DNA-binding transcriptional regulator YafY